MALRSRKSAYLDDSLFLISSSDQEACRKFLRTSVSFDCVGISPSRLKKPPKTWGLYTYDLRPPGPGSQPISNQPFCKIEVPAFWGLGNSHNKCLKKKYLTIDSRSRGLTPQRFNSRKRTGHCSANSNLSSWHLWQFVSQNSLQTGFPWFLSV